MKFYHDMVAKYANIRTFAPEDGAGSGVEGAGTEDNADAAQSTTDANNVTDADKSGAGKSADTKSAVKTTDVEDKSTTVDKEKADLLHEVMEKKNELKKLKEQQKKFEGVDLEKYQALIQKEQDRERQAAEAKGDFERVKKMMAEAHQAEKTKLTDEVKELREQLSAKDRIIEELTVGNVFGSSTFIHDSMVLSPSKTRVLYGAYFEYEDGVVVGYDKPRGSEGRTKLVDGSGNALGFDAALSKIVNSDPDKDSVLRQIVKSGSGSTTTTAKTDAKKTAPKLHGAALIAAALSK